MQEYKPLLAEAHTPPYKIHRYFARRPWNVFRQLIELYSNEGDIVLDPFCGGGVTIYEGLKLKRKTVGIDLNPLSIFIVKNTIKKMADRNELIKAYNEIASYIDFLYSTYESIEADSKQQALVKKSQPIEWNELAFIVKCNLCGKPVVLSNENKVSNGKYSCQNPNCKGNKKSGFIEPRNCERIGYDYLYSVVFSPIDKKKTVINFDSNRRKQLDNHLAFLKEEIKKHKIEIPKNKIPFDWDRQHEDLLFKKNITTFQDLFTERNLLINLLTLDFIKKLGISNDTLETLRLIFSSSLRDTNIMAFTNDTWASGKPTTWSKHAYWIPSQFCEVNILSAFNKAFNRVKKALDYNDQFDYKIEYGSSFSDLNKGSNTLLRNKTLSEADVPDNSIDAIVTDPPYGSNVQYLELSHFWYVWNKDLYNGEPDFTKEAVFNRKKNFNGAKTLENYENNLSSVFKECYRVLKPGKKLVMTFNNKDAGAWLALLISIFKAGFSFKKNGLFFQDGVKNYRQTAHTKYAGAPYGDFIYIFEKDEKKTAKKFVNEKEFTNELNKTFSDYLTMKKNEDRNEIIRRMFLEAIPKIESFAKSNTSETHELYKTFNKSYFKSFGE